MNQQILEPILALDFGTSNSLAGLVFEGKKTSLLPLDKYSNDPAVMRTLLYFPQPDHCFYGQQAIEEYINDDMEGRMFRSFKSHLPNESYLGTMFNNRVLSLEFLVGVFLLEIKKRCEAHIQQKINKVVLGRPARYSMNDVADGFALHRMIKAAEFAGFKEVQFVPEPLAAAFDFRQHSKNQQNLLIGDFGGGTSDFTVMKLHDREFTNEDVLAIEGCSLAGDALDSVFMSNKLNEYFGAKSRYKLPLTSNVLTMPASVSQRLNLPAHIVHLKEKDTYEFIKEVKKCVLTEKDAIALNRLFALIEDNQIFPFFEDIEKAKRILSEKDETVFKFDYPDIEVSELLKKIDFIEWSNSVKTTIFDSLQSALVKSQLSAEQIDIVCLTGGTSKVPMIRDEFVKIFGEDKLKMQNAFQSVASGLIEVASMWSQNQIVYPIVKL